MRRRQLFESIRPIGSEPDRSALVRLLATPEDGRLKLYVTWKTLCLRKEQPQLFQQGDYLPLTAQGAKADHVAAFARKFENTNVIVVVSRLVAGLLNEGETAPIGPEIWEDTHIVVPSCPCSASYRNAFTGEVLSLPQNGSGATMSIAGALAQFPVAVLMPG